ncbi:uncharacterized protein BP5553_08084 [Venustampulla echinocandica]|uniref:Uncharacterized protein n=1 Tax=Venustampulla echinocandica TaxID=2656787 RepID=A0A370TFP6_9HELO|nr:uncharacterized protein BP5553_08084 [Venustampulla echinocandica]RDL33716.1 hypothetical protein BP5553_08084 [Venustampulla echinocandica]
MSSPRDDTPQDSMPLAEPSDALVLPSCTTTTSHQHVSASTFENDETSHGSRGMNNGLSRTYYDSSSVDYLHPRYSAPMSEFDKSQPATSTNTPVSAQLSQLGTTTYPSAYQDSTTGPYRHSIDELDLVSEPETGLLPSTPNGQGQSSIQAQNASKYYPGINTTELSPATSHYHHTQDQHQDVDTSSMSPSTWSTSPFMPGYPPQALLTTTTPTLHTSTSDDSALNGHETTFAKWLSSTENSEIPIAERFQK